MNIDSVLASVDTTDHFIIKVVKHEEPPEADIIEIDHQSIVVKNLRFLTLARDSVNDIKVFLNSGNPNFKLTKEIINDLPEQLFGGEILYAKIGKVSLKLRSENEYGLLTLPQLQKILNSK